MGFDRGRVQFFLGRRGRPETPAGVHQKAMRCAGRVDERLAVEAEGHQQDLAERRRVERGDRARHDVLVPVVEILVGAARREASVHQPQRLHHPRAAELVEDVGAAG